MSNVRLLPRLNDVGVTRCMEDLERLADTDAEPMGLDRRLTEYEAWIWYAPSGGSVSPELVAEIQTEMTAIATRHGYPERASEKQKSSFDFDAARWLAGHQHLASPELLRDDVWAFQTCVMLQELVVWRYSARQRARFAGGVRNALQRLWMRGRTFDLGEEAGSRRWRLLQGLSEDAMVQIFERASIASDPNLARAIAEGWLTTADRIGRGRMEDVMRRATKLLRLRNQIIDLSFLTPEELAAEVSLAFARSSAGIPHVDPTDDVRDDKRPFMSRIGRAFRGTRVGRGSLSN